MAKEIERKFLVLDDSYKALATGSDEIAQGYISADPDRTVRVRIKGSRAFLTVKTRNEGITRNEWEYPVPLADATDMLRSCCGKILRKIRHYVPAGDGLTWEIDEFINPHPGLLLAEIELPSADTPFRKPSFIGEEVSGNPAYYNSSLVRD